MGEFFFKTIKLKEDQLLVDIIDEISFEHNHNTRNANIFRLPFISTDMTRRFFSSNAIKLWRDIPDEIKNCETLPSFRRHFKKLLFEGAF